MIDRREILDTAGTLGLLPHVVEKDYVLGWMLAGIYRQKALAESWIFKGGTCLKKCYFETYRFSEDLDFTLTDPSQIDRDFLARHAPRPPCSFLVLIHVLTDFPLVLSPSPPCRLRSDPSQKLLHHAVDLPLPPESGFTLIGLVTLAQFEQGHRDRTVLAIPLDLVVFCESIAKNRQAVPNYVAVTAGRASRNICAAPSRPSSACSMQ